MPRPHPSALPTESDKPRAVQEMFDRIAPRYDRMNRLLTGRMDQRWRTAVLDALAIGPGDRVLDLACGTGDFAEAIATRGGQPIGLDFARVMLDHAAQRLGTGVPLVQADALRLPLAAASMDAAVSGFALRNFVALAPVFAELARVVRPGGRIGLLEVDRPANRLVRFGHSVYFDRIVPFVGGLLSDRKAYAYLPQSTVYLPPEKELLEMIRSAGFTRVRKRRLMLGAAQAITAVRA